MAEQKIEQLCDNCGAAIMVWKYRAAEGDKMFNPPTDVPLVMVDGAGEMQTRAALVCVTCDGVKSWPRST